MATFQDNVISLAEYIRGHAMPDAPVTAAAQAVMKAAMAGVEHEADREALEWAVEVLQR